MDYLSYGCPASFQKMMEKVMNGITNALIYINHTQDHPGHQHILDQTLQHLDQHGLKIHLDKCYFRTKEVAYLGFTLLPDGILPGIEKIQDLLKF